MIIDVPYMSVDEIDHEANHLLRSFEAKYGTIQTLATPLDEVAENSTHSKATEIFFLL